VAPSVSLLPEGANAVNGGAISGRWGGAKAGQLGVIAGMRRGPIGPLRMPAAKIFRLAMSG
jgi:hypothetical protein